MGEVIRVHFRRCAMCNEPLEVGDPDFCSRECMAKYMDEAIVYAFGLLADEPEAS